MKQTNLNQIIQEIKAFRTRLETFVLETKLTIDKELIKQLIQMLNEAELSINEAGIIDFDNRWKFERQAFIGRYFLDWGLGWIARDYLKISEYIKAHCWNKKQTANKK